MDPETIFNFFLICSSESDIITHIGFRVHDLAGSDEEKGAFLRTRVEEDSREMAVTDIPEGLTVHWNDQKIRGVTRERYYSLLYEGTEGILYEPIFKLFDAPETPFFVATLFVDGKIVINQTENFKAATEAKFVTQITEHLPMDYLTAHMTPEGFDMPALINSDFTMSIRLLFKNGKYVSCCKLLMSAIDTFAFLELGDVSGNFKTWLTTYCDLIRVGVTDAELWELRNGLLHMTNTHSKKVIQNKVKQLYFYVNPKDISFMKTAGEIKYFNLLTFIHVVNAGIAKWCESYNINHEKRTTFIERYDLIISDSRYVRIESND